MYLQRRSHMTFQVLKCTIILPIAIFFAGCHDGASQNNIAISEKSLQINEGTYLDSLMEMFNTHPDYYASGFDFPVGKPDAKGYYNAQPFKKNNHLGDDWNGVRGGNTDFGDTIYAVSHGFITQSIQFFGGWGKVMRQACVWKLDSSIEQVECLYAHMDNMLVKKGDWVVKGQPIGTIGSAEGKYLAHLHFEIRKVPGMDLGAGYSSDTTGFIDPTNFILLHRKLLD